MTRYAAVYCRLSPRPDDQYAGVGVQERLGRSYAEQHWPTVPVKVYRDEGISASKGDMLPELDKLREDVRAGLIAHVWSVEQSRLERREAEWFVLAAELDGAGITELHTHRDGIVSVRSAVAGIKAVINAEEIRRMKQRVNDRLADNAAQGLPHGTPRCGYRQAVNGDGARTFVIVESEAALIREAAERLLDGWGLTTIARSVQDRGIVGSRGGRVQARHVYNWLTSPTVAGYRVYRGEIVGRGNWTPILDENTWQAVKAKLTARSTGPSAGRKYLLTGIAVCGSCGAPMRCAPRKLADGKVPYLQCPSPVRGGKRCTGIRMLDVEQYVLDALWTELDTPEFLDAIGADDHVQQRDAITKKLTDLAGRRTKLAEQWGAGDLTDIDWAAARRSLTETERRLRTELSEIPPMTLAVDITEARAAWPDMILDEQRQFLRLFIDRVRVLPGRRTAAERVAIEWRTTRPT